MLPLLSHTKGTESPGTENGLLQKVSARAYSSAARFLAASEYAVLLLRRATQYSTCSVRAQN